MTNIYLIFGGDYLLIHFPQMTHQLLLGYISYYFNYTTKVKGQFFLDY
jgi:hypothetical protein